MTKTTKPLTSQGAVLGSGISTRPSTALVAAFTGTGVLGGAALVVAGLVTGDHSKVNQGLSEVAVVAGTVLGGASVGGFVTHARKAIAVEAEHVWLAANRGISDVVDSAPVQDVSPGLTKADVEQVVEKRLHEVFPQFVSAPETSGESTF